MVFSIDLDSLPNQEFTTKINNHEFRLTLHTIGENDNEFLACKIEMDGELLCPFTPVFANQVIMPYPYMEDEAGGNFAFSTENDNYPTWSDLGKSCFLYFLTKDELNG